MQYQNLVVGTKIRKSSIKIRRGKPTEIVSSQFQNKISDANYISYRREFQSEHLCWW